MFSRCNSRKLSGFTLIELLVVIAIIALLLSILMPALSVVKRRAQELVCRTNLHQWYIAHLNYAGDNKDKMMESYGWVDASGQRAHAGAWPVEMVFDADGAGRESDFYDGIIAQSRIRPYMPGFNDAEYTYSQVVAIPNSSVPEAEYLELSGGWKCPANRDSTKDNNITRIKSYNGFRVHYSYFYGVDRFGDVGSLINGCSDPKTVSGSNQFSGRQILLADSLYIGLGYSVSTWNHGLNGPANEEWDKGIGGYTITSEMTEIPISGINRCWGDGSADWKSRKEFDLDNIVVPGGYNQYVLGEDSSGSLY